MYNVDDPRIETHITNTSVSKNYVFNSRMSVQEYLNTQTEESITAFWNCAY